VRFGPLLTEDIPWDHPYLIALSSFSRIMVDSLAINDFPQLIPDLYLRAANGFLTVWRPSRSQKSILQWLLERAPFDTRRY
jgi:hypothetical protein